MWIWILGTAGGLILLALVLHFLVPAKGVKVPAVVLGTLGGLVGGTIIGMGGAIYYGDQVHKVVYEEVYRPSPMPKSGGAQRKSDQTPPAEEKKEAPPAAAPKQRVPSNYPGLSADPSKAPPETPKDDLAKPKS